MDSRKNDIVFIGNGRDFHGIDWYRMIKEICKDRRVRFATDLIDSEGQTRLLNGNDEVIPLHNIDSLLFSHQSHAGNVWRNLIKLLVFPLQAHRVKQIARNNPDSIFHAHTMYYMFLCWVAGIRFIGTPQGSEILVRPHRSKMYRFFAIKSLLAADHVFVDSVNMRNGVFNLCKKEAEIVQFGIDVPAISEAIDGTAQRSSIVSMRGLYPLYRIHEILEARSRCSQPPALLLFYPFCEAGYRAKIIKKLVPGDVDLGRIPTKAEMYKRLSSTLLVISIPESDSSPRSVYEAIFCGCCVAVTYSPWIDTLPACMKSRISIVDLKDELWLEKAIEHARLVTKVRYVPSEAALDLFDQRRSMKAMADRFY